MKTPVSLDASINMGFDCMGSGLEDHVAEVMDRGAELRARLVSLARHRQELGKQIGRRVLHGEPVNGLRTARAKVMEAMEDVSLAVVVLDAEGD